SDLRRAVGSCGRGRTEQQRRRCNDTRSDERRKELSPHVPSFSTWTFRRARREVVRLANSPNPIDKSVKRGKLRPGSRVHTLEAMERKLATVLFVDLVDSTALVTGSDPEGGRRRVQAYCARVSPCVTTNGGIVEKFAGDAVMAAFGIPQAHEDDAERAVRAAAAILDSVHELGLEARIGGEAGEVVADESDSTFATGEAVNVAARLQQAAGPGQIVLGPGAHRLTLGRVEVEDVGPVELKGLGREIWAWRALSTKSDGLREMQQAPLVGRDH